MAQRLSHLTYARNPLDVVNFESFDSNQVLDDHDVTIQQLYAPINPADINMCQGAYYLQPDLPSSLGNEGVGKVMKLGAKVTSLSLGDHVIHPFKSKDNWQGSWATEYTTSASNLIKIPKTIDEKQASMLTINPITAWLMLTTFKSLKKGDWVLQNAANSGVGRWVIYLSKKLGIHTINIIRDQRYTEELKALGADHVLMYSSNISKKVKTLSPSISLALNGVGGDSATELSRSLSSNGVMVTYGAMSQQPITIGNGGLIYKNITLTGFNRTKWIEDHDRQQVLDATRILIEYLNNDPFEVPIEAVYLLSDYKKALAHSLESRRGKILFDLRP